MAVVAAGFGVFCRLQVTDLDSFLLFFPVILFFFPVRSAFSQLSSRVTYFWPFTEVVRKIAHEVTRKSDGPTVAQTVKTTVQGLRVSAAS